MLQASREQRTSLWFFTRCWFGERSKQNQQSTIQVIRSNFTKQIKSHNFCVHLCWKISSKNVPVCKTELSYRNWASVIWEYIQIFFLKWQLKYASKSPEICFRALFQRQKARIHNNSWAALTLEGRTSSRRISTVLQHSTCPHHQIGSQK